MLIRQMFINYCKENLHQNFIELALKSKQKKYLREGVEWINIDHFNNKAIVNLIEARPEI